MISDGPDIATEVRLPERFSYRLKNKLLGSPLHSERLEHERLGNPTALAVFASDCLSSSAYATEEILRVLIPVVGIGAFSLVVPLTTAMLGVLTLLILSYRQTIKAYPTASGAYVVTKDNFGLFSAQIAGVSLLTDYILTVAVSTAAGTAAIASIYKPAADHLVPIAVFFVSLIAFVNLRGVKESGKMFAAPTYFFILNMVALLGVGVYKILNGTLTSNPIEGLPGAIDVGSPGMGVFMGASLFRILHAFSSGGTAVTGVEAISDGVSAFRQPAWKNAQKTLVIMGLMLGTMFLGLSVLASKVHAIPFEKGTPTVIYQIGKYVYGSHGLGDFMVLSLQAATMLILVLAANTGFADFPRLASFAAGDNFLPRQLMKRGHRLVFSNGIVTLAGSAILLLIATGAHVSKLIPMYAIGVFTSFTLSQSGMARHHLRHKAKGWKNGFLLNGFGAVISFLVGLTFAVTKFVEGAWVILVLVPILIAILYRLNGQYKRENIELERDVKLSAEQKMMRRHTVFVLVDDLDVAAARAMQYARTLNPDELRAVHFDLDPLVTKRLVESWTSLGLSRFPLDIVECPDRRIGRASLELVLEGLRDGETEVSVLIPRLEYKRFWHRLLHDQSAKRISNALSRLPHCNVTIVPYVFGSQTIHEMAIKTEHAGHAAVDLESAHFENADGTTGISRAAPRQKVVIEGTVHAMRVQPWAGVAALECVIQDQSGRISVVFIGRRQIAGIAVGARLRVSGVIGTHERRKAILNPFYELISTP